jgi:hypothetical protein
MTAASIRRIVYSAALVVGSATHLLAASITYDALNRPTLIRAVDLTGEGIFDVVVRYESFESVFGSGNPPSPLTPLFWGDSSGAHAAANAISQALNDDGPVVPLLPSSDLIFAIRVPYEYDSRPGNTSGWVHSPIVYIFSSLQNPMYSANGDDLTKPTASFENLGWASFEVVPEPSTLSLATFGLIALIATWNWRRIGNRPSPAS